MPPRRERPAPKPDEPEKKPPAIPPAEPPPPPIKVGGQSFSVIVCPFCGADKPKVLRTSPSEGARWYECRACRVFDSERGSVFKIPMKRGDGA